MNESTQSQEQILVALHEQTAYFRVLLRGSFRVSSGLKQVGGSMVEKGIRRFVIDMHECTGMDSTFMGVLAGLSFRLNKCGGGEIILIGLTARTRGLLATLGLDRLVAPFMEGSTPDEIQQALQGISSLSEVESRGEERRSTAEMMLEAHENLVEVTPENLPKFKDVLQFLREDVKKASEPDT